ncbi:MAG: tyrosine-type recombinase/integrase [Acidimicrobiia bacterium]
MRDLCEAWYRHVEPDLSASVAPEYRRLLDRRILPRLGRLPLSKLAPADLDRWYGELRSGDNSRPLAANSVRRIHSVLHRALDQGVRWGWLDANPANRASPPAVRRPELTVPDPTTVARVIAEARRTSPALACFLRLAATTGARRGELCALRWCDVDFEAASLTIRHGVVEHPTRGVVVQDTKTHAARHLALDPTTVDVLGAHRNGAADDAFLFSHASDGSRPWRPHYVTLAFTRLRNRLGLPSVRLHDLRHFAATQLLAGGQDVRTVAGRLGHADASVTLGTYAHFLAVADRRAAELLGQLLD